MQLIWRLKMNFPMTRCLLDKQSIDYQTSSMKRALSMIYREVADRNRLQRTIMWISSLKIFVVILNHRKDELPVSLTYRVQAYGV